MLHEQESSVKTNLSLHETSISNQHVKQIIYHFEWERLEMIETRHRTMFCKTFVNQRQRVCDDERNVDGGLDGEILDRFRERSEKLSEKR